MNILVLCGGLSTERDVSLSSGSLIANALCRKGHGVALADIYLGVKKEDMYFCTDRIREHKISESVPDLEKLIEQNGGRREPVGENIIEFCKMADAVFLALHGGIGENGVFQELLEKNGIRFTGSSSLGCKTAMDKIASKKLAVSAGVKTADWLDETADISELKKAVPCFVKPVDAGSSVGITKVEDEEDISSAISEAQKYCQKVLIEKQIFGREFSVGVLDGMALPPIEIITENCEFYDYKTKYQAGLVKEICPADITDEQDKLLRASAERMHRALGLGTYSRIDFILTDKDEAFFLEANALPGMTPTSLFPQEAAAVGISYQDLCMKIVEMSR